MKRSKAELPRPQAPADGASLAEIEAYHDREREYLLSAYRIFAREAGVIPDYSAKPHDEMCDQLQSGMNEYGVARRQKKMLYLAPRGSFKTTLIMLFMVYLMLWYRARGIDIRIVYIRAQHELAQDVLFEIKHSVFQNPTIMRLWGDLSDQATAWNETEINLGTSRDPTISTGGLTVGMAGLHPDIIIIDDGVNEDNYNSIKARRSIRVKVKSCFPVLQPWGSLIVAGTRWPGGDYYGEIIKENEHAAKQHKKYKELGNFEEAARWKPQWDIYIRGAHNADGTLFFPSRLSEAFLDQQKQSDEEGFFYYAWYENSPLDETKMLFPKEHRSFFSGNFYFEPTPTIELVDECGVTQRQIPIGVTMTIDPTTTATGTSDSVGVTIVGCDAKGDWWVLLAKGFLTLPSTLVSILSLYIRTFMPAKIGIEPGGLDPEFVAELQTFITDNHLSTQIVTLEHLRGKSGRKSKFTRIAAMEPRHTYKRMHFMRGDWCVQVQDQLNNYPNITHDDIIDALAMQSGFVLPSPYLEVHESMQGAIEQDDALSLSEEWNGRSVVPLYDRHGAIIDRVTVDPRVEEKRARTLGSAGINATRWKVAHP
jgi:phage terminase large subunit-like protein